MEGLARTIRLVIGLGMLAAGSVLAAPAGLHLAAWLQEGNGRLTQPATSTTVEPPAAAWPILAGDAALEAMRQSGSPPAGPASWPASPSGASAADRSYYRPPVPPSPLPPVALGLAAPGSDLSAAYRSTLDVPPPPLIDGQRPPPLAVGWTGRTGRAADQQRSPPPASTYRVRDGDDLITIASRFYGTPAAAGLIWEANRGRLTDPALLPIGVDLVLPDPAAVGPAAGRALDPVISRPGRPAAAGRPEADPWLGAPS